jgi:hypothetical protein
MCSTMKYLTSPAFRLSDELNPRFSFWMWTRVLLAVNE